MWSSSGSNTHLLEIRYDLVQHLEYGGQIRADGKHPKIKNTPTITPDRPLTRYITICYTTRLPFSTSNRVGEFSPLPLPLPHPHPEKLIAKKHARIPSDRFTKKKSIHLFFLFLHIRILNVSLFLRSKIFHVSYFVSLFPLSGKKFFIELFNLHFNRPANAMIELIRVNHERDSRTISCLSSLFEWMAGGITVG